MNKKLLSIFISVPILAQCLPIVAHELESLEEMEMTNSSIEIYQLYNPNSGEHFYTSDQKERDSLTRLGWKNEGIKWKAPLTSNTPIYRLYNPNQGDHHYTLDPNEIQSLVNLGWENEGIKFYSDDSYRIPIFRLYNPKASKAGSHHYTLSEEEILALTNLGWINEGLSWYGVEASVPSPNSIYSFEQIAGDYGFEMSHGGNKLTIESNGNFIGEYGYMARGDRETNYPNGTRYYCTYRGKMMIQGDQLIITQLSIDEIVGSSYIENGIRYLVSDIEKELEITNNSTFIIYPLGTSYSSLDSRIASQLKSGYHNGSTTPTYSLVLINSKYPRGYRKLNN